MAYKNRIAVVVVGENGDNNTNQNDDRKYNDNRSHDDKEKPLPSFAGYMPPNSVCLHTEDGYGTQTCSDAACLICHCCLMIEET
jgi:hypothetical protein